MVDTQKRREGMRRLARIVALRPRTPDQLHRFVDRALGVKVGRRAIVAGSSPPLDYLCHGFFEHGDCVVWASRGGGKTMLGAVATLLDLLFKPGIQVRILGGSLEQATKMHGYLLGLLERPALRGVTAGAPTQRTVRLHHGSVAEVLAASQRSVRGVRVHKLRVDEVEELDPRLWEAAQLVTRSGLCGGRWVRGSVEALSTMHRPMGVMAGLVGGGAVADGRAREAGEDESPMPASTPSPPTSHRPPATSPRVFRWNALDVAARCEPERDCGTCALWDDCGGRAKHASGFVAVADLVAQRGRISDRAWASEMMCRRPTRADAVYEQFEEAVHVAGPTQNQAEDGRWIAGMDFGLRSPTVMLWAQVRGEGEAARVHILGEYAQRGRTLPIHLEAIDTQARKLGLAPLEKLAWIGVDPAGRQRNAHTGRSDIALLRRAGAKVRTRGSRIVDGIEGIRRRLDRRTLTIHPRCTGLIHAMAGYHFDPDDPARETPIKDGPDHWCDALRYMLVNLQRDEASVKVVGW